MPARASTNTSAIAASATERRIFTDGLFEIPGKSGGEMLGEPGLNEVLKTLRGLPPSLVVGEILQDLKDFQGHSKFEDDVSLMVARRSSPHGSGVQPSTSAYFSAISAIASS